MNQLRYYFDGKKISGSQANKDAYVKGVFQTLFQNTTIPAGKTVSLQTEIFETIWANNGLRQSLFPETVGKNTQWLNINKNRIQGEFAITVSDTNDSFYSFIKVR